MDGKDFAVLSGQGGSRRNRTAALVAVLASACFGAGPAGPPPASAAAAPAFRPDSVVLGFQPGVSAARQRAIEASVSGARARRLGPVVRGRRHAAAVAVRVRGGRGRVLSSVRALRRRHEVRFAEPDYLMHEDGAPNDPSFGLQWGSSNTGQLVNGIRGTSGADDKALAAWGVSTGSRAVVIGEADSGVDYRHPDLAANMWSNPGGVGGCGGGTHGYNVLTGKCDPMDDETYYHGHGTHVAGILGAVGNNSTGVAGVNWSTTILPVKWLNSAGDGSTSQLISALNWLVKAKQAGVNLRVVNDSATYVGTAYSQALADEIDVLGANDILFVTAAGNTGDNNDDLSYRRYPCGYDRPTEICVTASNQSDQLPSWANYGATTVDLAAPGDNVYSTLRNGAYGYVSGGSMASPQVAGTAALILSKGYLSASGLKDDILRNVDLLPSLSGRVRTGGRLDVCRALPGCAVTAPPSSPPANTAPPAVSGTPRSGASLAATTGSWSNTPTGYAYQWKRCDSAGANCAGITGATGQSYTLGATDVGATLRVAVTASNSAGASAPATSAATAVVQAAPATFGQTGVGGSTDSFAGDRKRVNAYSLPTAGSVSKLSVYLAPTGTAGQQALRGVVYADSGGSPGALLATSNELVFHSSDAARWYDLVLPSPLRLAAGRYWIGVITGGTSYVAGFRWSSVAGSRVYNGNTYTAGATNPFGPASTDSEQMSLFATYTPG
jgi:subtilisin family serine protease